MTRRVLFCSALLFVSAQAAYAGSRETTQQQYMKLLDRMMVDLAGHSAVASQTVKREYRAYLDLLVLDEFAAIEDALETGGLVPLPEPERFNLRPRTEGPAPIAEKDLDNQQTYISARPATIGALLDIASRVKSGPLEITSLVRHSEYQDALRTTNSNANTSVPMHTMGLAVDIALINTPLKTIYEIRDVLRQMQAAGDILFIGERKQLVFHVVPHPSRLGHYNDLYARAMSTGQLRLASATTQVIAPLAKAVVSTEVAAIRPTDAHAAEWWAAEGVASNLTVAVSPSIALHSDNRWFITRLAARAAAFVGGLVETAKDMLT